MQVPDEVKGIKVGIIGAGVDMLDNAVQHKGVTTRFGSFSSLYTGTIDGVKVMAVARHGNGSQPIAPHQIPYETYMPLFAETKYLIGLSRVGDLTGKYPTGAFVVPNDFVTFLPHTLHLEGAEFANCNALVDKKLRETIAHASLQSGIDIYTGNDLVYITHPGPQFETPAEARFYQTQHGGTIAGMTSGYEAKLAAELRAYNKAHRKGAFPKYACICTVVNPASNHTKKVSHAITEEEMRKAKPRLETLVRTLVHLAGQDL